MKPARGFLLIELVFAASLFSIASAGLYTGFTAGLAAEKKIRETRQTLDPVRVAFLRMRRDLRNAVPLRDYPFEGKASELRFAALLPAGGDEARNEIHLIRYFMKDNSLCRSDQRLGPGFSKMDPEERLMSGKETSVNFLFPYQDAGGQTKFQPFWMEDPYFGIPRAVRAEFRVESNGAPQLFSKTISIFQGHTGHLAPDQSETNHPEKKG